MTVPGTPGARDASVPGRLGHGPGLARPWGLPYWAGACVPNPDLRGPDRLPARLWRFPLLVTFVVLLMMKVAHSSKF